MTERFRQTPPLPPSFLNRPKPLLREREVLPEDEIDVREYSKEEMMTERSNLAADIALERSEGRDKISELNEQMSLLEVAVEQERQNIEATEMDLDDIENVRTDRANSLAGKFKNFLRIETADDEHIVMVIEAMRENIEFSKTKHGEMVTTLEESANELIDVDARLKALKDKISAHYVEASDRIKQTVEQTMLRNNVFIVHTINEHDSLRHNANSNVSKEATFEDDLDILLSLEPSVSASSLHYGADDEGKVSGMWSRSGGLLLGGGTISAASTHDIDTVSYGIKSRVASKSNQVKVSTDIDKAVQRPRDMNMDDERAAYNELVVDNPETIGYFREGYVDEEGTMWTSDTVRKQYFNVTGGRLAYGDEEALFKRNIARDQERFRLIKSKGLPYYIMTPDRKFFEVFDVYDTGRIFTGEELTPEKAAKSNAGLLPEKRKELGQKVLEKNVFLHDRTVNEARKIIEEL